MCLVNIFGASVGVRLRDRATITRVVRTDLWTRRCHLDLVQRAISRDFQGKSLGKFTLCNWKS